MLRVLVLLLVIVLSSSVALPQKFSNEPFTGGIVAGFRGVDVKALFSALKKNDPIRGEYETSSDFQLRQSRKMAKPILGTITVDSTVAVVFVPDKQCDQNVSSEYDADRGILKVHLSDTRADKSFFIAPWACVTKSGHSFVGENSYGARAQVQFSDSEPVWHRSRPAKQALPWIPIGSRWLRSRT